MTVIDPVTIVNTGGVVGFAAVVYYRLQRMERSNNSRLDRVIELMESQGNAMSLATGKMTEFAINTREALQRIEVRQGNGKKRH